MGIVIGGMVVVVVVVVVKQHHPYASFRRVPCPLLWCKEGFGCASEEGGGSGDRS